MGKENIRKMNFFKVFSIFFLSRAFEIPVEHRLRTNAAMMAFRAMKNAEIPYNSLDELTHFYKIWTKNWLLRNQIEHWNNKFSRNTERLKVRYDICGDEDVKDFALGEIFEDERGERMLRDQPVKSLELIVNGYAKWSQAFIHRCKHQPRVQVLRAKLWFEKLTELVEKNHPDFLMES